MNHLVEHWDHHLELSHLGVFHALSCRTNQTQNQTNLVYFCFNIIFWRSLNAVLNLTESFSDQSKTGHVRFLNSPLLTSY